MTESSTLVIDTHNSLLPSILSNGYNAYKNYFVFFYWKVARNTAYIYRINLPPRVPASSSHIDREDSLEFPHRLGKKHLSTVPCLW